MKYVRKDETNVHERIMEQYINEKLGGNQKKAPEGMCVSNVDLREEHGYARDAVEGIASRMDSSRTPYLSLFFFPFPNSHTHSCPG